MPEPNSIYKQMTAERLSITLAHRIESGQYVRGEWLPTERELAAEFQVDRSMVRVALASLTEQQLIVRNPGHRPRVCSSASSGAELAIPRTLSKSVQKLAFISPQSNFFPASPAIQRGALQAIKDRESPHHLMVFDNGGDIHEEVIRRERRALQSIISEGVSGAILWHEGAEHTLPDIRRVQEAGISLVLVDRLPADLACDFVGVDNVAGAREAVAYLLKLGHTRILHMSVDSDTSTVVDRAKGYCDAMHSRGLRPGAEWIYRYSKDADLQSPIRPDIDYILALPVPPTAIFAVNDLVAHCVTVGLQERGFKVPEMFSIMGFDNMDSHTLRPSTLTTVDQPFEQMGRKAVEILLNRISRRDAGPRALQHTYLATQLVVRTSCLPYSGR